MGITLALRFHGADCAAELVALAGARCETLQGARRVPWLVRSLKAARARLFALAASVRMQLAPAATGPDAEPGRS